MEFLFMYVSVCYKTSSCNKLVNIYTLFIDAKLELIILRSFEEWA